MNAVDVPRWAELSVAKIYEWAIEHETLKMFIPDFNEYRKLFLIY